MLTRRRFASLGAMLRFGLGNQFRSVATYIYIATFFTVALVAMLGTGGALDSNLDFGEDQVKVNSPFILTTMIEMLAMFGMLIVAGVAGRAACRDFESRADPLFFTAPVGKGTYLGGRFLEATITLAVVFSFIGLGLYVATLAPGMEPLKLGPNRLMSYVQPYLLLVIPNIFILGALFFSFALVVRKMAAIYTTSIVLLTGFLGASMVSDKIENRWIAALIDPFGNEALDRTTQYWTIFEKNTRLLRLEGPLLWNRVFWLSLSIGVLVAAFRMFRMNHAASRAASLEEAPDSVVKPAHLPAPTDRRSAPAFFRLTSSYFLATVRSPYFAIIALAGIALMVLGAKDAGMIYGTPTWPVTYQMVDIATGNFTLIMLVLITFFSGDLVWRERDAGMAELADTLPLSDWVPYAAKLAALCLVPVFVNAILIVTGICFQLANGYHRLELSLYLRELLGLRLIPYLLVAVLAFAVQVIVNHKYIGHAVMVVYYLMNFIVRFGYEHPLYRYGSSPGHLYSDMNGFGSGLAGEFWFAVYWGAFAVLLAVLARLLWVRGLAVEWKWRLRLARARFRVRTSLVAGGTGAVFACTGCFLFYHTNVLNEYLSSYDRDELTARYERTYKRYQKTPQPSITATTLRVELDPPHGAYRVQGRYAIANKTGHPIERVLVTAPMGKSNTIHAMQFQPAAVMESQDRHAGLRIYRMVPPLPPGAVGSLAFDIESRPRSFYGQSRTVVANGSFLDYDVFPHFGYNDESELSEDGVRRRHGLDPKPRAADINDLAARRRNDTSRDADWVTMDITIGTAPDQIAAAPGELVREWQEGGRRYFQYRTQGKALEFVSVLSARYRTLRDQWNGVDLAIYYQPGHEYNLARMMEGLKASLAYCSENFAPYQNRSLRILEFPRYDAFAESFLASVPYAESMGFISRVDPADEADVDFPYFVTAHEVAHQWWGHQAVGANVQGATVVSESLAEYTALMVMQHRYGQQRIRHFLRYVLDQYLHGRSNESNHEVPLIRAEGQSYLHYYKGGLVFYALQDYIGEAALNRALRSYLRKVAYQEPPYTTSLELEASVREVIPPQYAYLIDDFFDTITLYENRAISASAREIGAGKYEVKLKVEAKKFKADGFGVEKAVPLADWIDIGVLDAKGQALYLAKHKIEKPETELTLMVNGAPAKAGIDPWNKLVDRTPEDNVIKVGR
jgi:hypothetical protein